MKKKVVAIIGPGDHCSPEVWEAAYELGKRLGKEHFLLVTGGRNVGVMDAASKGASESGGEVMGILPDAEGNNASSYLDFLVKTDAGSGRNNFVVLTGDVVVAFEGGGGTLSEIGLAIKANKPLALYQTSKVLSDLVEEKYANAFITSDLNDLIDWVKNES